MRDLARAMLVQIAEAERDDVLLRPMTIHEARFFAQLANRYDSEQPLREHTGRTLARLWLQLVPPFRRW